MNISDRYEPSRERPELSPLNICEQLKKSTDDLHRTVEQTLAKTLFSSALTPQQYYNILTAMVRCYTPMESSLKQFPKTQCLLQQRQKLAWLNEDIDYLTPLCRQPPTAPTPMMVSVNSQAEAFGMMYVLEGATLGGNHIQRALSKHSWLSTHQGLRFFYAYGEARAEKWSAFRAELQAFVDQQPSSAPAIIHGAKMAFTLIHQSIVDTI